MIPMEAVTLGQNAISITLLLSAPLLLVGMVVGLLVALFQATTQIQEMTLTFVPKIVAVMLALLFFSSWMLIKLSDYTSNLFLSIPDIIR
ncbi:MAG: EscS/YscS/HrcS family type III secretion system export apparatus protein [Desulfobulbaceae bacterium DB1]|nr:MAG: EscS/YscS/HrcS family type III secretion system export apparatus protein [Desulfobulbaceae bacterium DB1]